MSEAVVIEAINVTPSVLWVFVAFIAFWMLRRAIQTKLGQVKNVKASGVEFSFAEHLLDEAASKVDTGQAPSAADRRSVISRLEHAVDSLAGGRILWVDDNPDWNRPLIDLFRQAKMTVDIEQSTASAMTLARSRPYDLVITDMRRDNEHPADRAGITLVHELRGYGVQAPVVIFATAFDPRLGVDPAIFAYTNTADELVHLVIDIMERVKFGAVF
ncbi:response regulator [Natronosporangium hydrolyticum]|uniref:Response regulator n=1 Tax=Natronosporangium hydrolyticum TaxID=2811111 RepID=A0A895YJE6_9ACTN|nr:response regulator [Natronosporangium hydrolyticum]QSB14726.1 response regulator [Natronosporangium hydrolyticum]